MYLTPNELSLLTNLIHSVRKSLEQSVDDLRAQVSKISAYGAANSQAIKDLNRAQELHNDAVMDVLNKQSKRIDCMATKQEQHEDDPLPQVRKLLSKKTAGGGVSIGGVIIALVGKFILGWY